MSEAGTGSSEPSFAELFGRGEASADDIDRFIERWHEGASVRARALPLHAYLGLCRDEYEQWVKDPASLPRLFAARRERASGAVHRPRPGGARRA